MKCILCNSDTFKIVTKKLRNNIERNVVQCLSCKLVSLENPSENIVDYDKNYREKHSPILGKKLSPSEFFNYELQFQNSRVDRIKSYLKPEMDVLEIGSSTGHFLYSIKDYVNSLTGIELDKSFANYSREIENFTIYDEPIEKINFNGKKFDVVFLLQVFEHISNPQNLLNQIKKCLNENGIIYIEVPNINDALYSIYNLESYVEFNFRLPHVYYYSDITLEKMLSSCDFKGETGFHQDFSFLNHIHWLQNNSPQKDQKKATDLISWNTMENEFTLHSEIIKNWFLKTNEEYKKLLCESGTSEVLSYVGKIKN